MMRRHASLAAALICASLALPAGASARLSEIGDSNAAVPACPSKPCYAITKTTGYVTRLNGRPAPYVVPRDGHLVAWSITLGNPNKKQTKFFTDNLGGAASAQITVLKPGKKGVNQVMAQSLPQKLTRYFGTTAQFAMHIALGVRAGWIVAITTPTWVPALAVNLPTSTSWRASRGKGHCDETAKQTAQTGPRDSTQYYCLYKGARLTYSATLVSTP